MYPQVRRLQFATALATFVLPAAFATEIPRLSFEELTDTSSLVLTGTITRSWSAWEPTHKYIWTHYEVAVESVQKGAPARLVEFAEPGGTVDGFAMNVEGAVVYRPSDQVLVFLQRVPNGYLRTTGWGQGKYSVDKTGTLHAHASLRTLDGLTVQQAAQRIASRVRDSQVKGAIR
jgi:hypothetical protein